ncbi:MAG: ATP phosphoribosyltransferase regulatory subunit, partial [Solimonas sp.]
YTVNARLVRGLDYYTSTVFEWTTRDLGAQGTVLAGGRYDGLVEQLGGTPSPAVGWASGVERLLLLQKAQAVAVESGDAHVYFCWLGEAAQRAARQLAEQLREALPGLRLVLHAGGGKLAAQLKRADRSGAGLALILGDAETGDRTVQVKSLRGGPETADAAQFVAWPELTSRLAGLVKQSVQR